MMLKHLSFFSGLKFFIFIAFFSFSFQGCNAAKEILKQGGIQKPTVSVTHVDVQNISLLSVDFVFDLKVTNPNPVGINLSGFDYELLINQKSFVKGDQEEPMEIKAKKSSLVHLPLTVDFADIFGVFKDLATKNKASYRLNTGFHFDLPALGKVRVPASKEGKFDLR